MQWTGLEDFSPLQDHLGIVVPRPDCTGMNLLRGFEFAKCCASRLLPTVISHHGLPGRSRVASHGLQGR